MGLWPFGGKKGELEPVKEAATRGAPQTESSRQQADKAEKLSDESAATESPLMPEEIADLPLPAVFEFGGAAVESGVTMKGICAVDDPDQIQACLWRVDPVPKDTPQSEAKYQILF